MDARQLIIAVMKDVQGVAKRDKNQAQGFNFRGIDAVLNAIGPVIRQHGGFIVPNVLSADTSTGTTAKGGVINIIRLQVQFSVYGSEGEPIIGDVAAEAFDSGDKATAKAMSVALRTFLIQLLALPTDEPDPDASTYELAPAKKTEAKNTELTESQLKQEIAKFYPERPKSEITAALWAATGKDKGWSMDELKSFHARLVAENAK